MATRASFLNRPYGGYLHNDIPEEDDELTHVGPGTPCGEYLRRFWQPVATSDELKELPHRIRIMGEDLVVFRGGSGQVGLLELHCSHRGSSLEFGQICQKGIRCCYHGWLFDVDGRVMETPGEPTDSTLKDRLYHGAYPTLEYKSLVFAYMGPPDKKPEFPVYDTFEQPGRETLAGRPYVMPCNWLQFKENSMDPAHLLYLHTTISGAQVGQEVAQAFQERPEWDFLETPIGMLYIDTRRVDDKVWVRIADYMPPTLHQFPPSGQLGKEEDFYGRPDSAHWAVPVDDTHTKHFMFRLVRDGTELPQTPAVGQASMTRPYEEQQRHPGDWEAQVSQRPIAVHGLEHLATTDRGVIMFRNIVKKGIQAVEEGRDPEGILREPGGVIPTYCSDTMVTVPAADDVETDKELIRETGRKVAKGYVKDPSALAGQVT